MTDKERRAYAMIANLRDLAIYVEDMQTEIDMARDNGDSTKLDYGAIKKVAIEVRRLVRNIESI